MIKYEYLTKFLICTFKYKGIGIKDGVFNDNSNCFYKKGFSADKMVDFNSFFGYALFDNNAYISHRNTKRGTHEEIETIDKEKLCHDISQFISEVHHIYVEKSAFEDGNINYSEEYKKFLYHIISEILAPHIFTDKNCDADIDLYNIDYEILRAIAEYGKTPVILKHRAAFYYETRLRCMKNFPDIFENIKIDWENESVLNELYTLLELYPLMSTNDYVPDYVKDNMLNALRENYIDMKIVGCADYIGISDNDIIKWYEHYMELCKKEYSYDNLEILMNLYKVICSRAGKTPGQIHIKSIVLESGSKNLTTRGQYFEELLDTLYDDTTIGLVENPDKPGTYCIKSRYHSFTGCKFSLSIGNNFKKLFEESIRNENIPVKFETCTKKDKALQRTEIYENFHKFISENHCINIIETSDTELNNLLNQIMLQVILPALFDDSDSKKTVSKGDTEFDLTSISIAITEYLKENNFNYEFTSEFDRIRLQNNELFRKLTILKADWFKDNVCKAEKETDNIEVYKSPNYVMSVNTSEINYYIKEYKQRYEIERTNEYMCKAEKETVNMEVQKRPNLIMSVNACEMISEQISIIKEKIQNNEIECANEHIIKIYELIKETPIRYTSVLEDETDFFYELHEKAVALENKQLHFSIILLLLALEKLKKQSIAEV